MRPMLYFFEEWSEKNSYELNELVIIITEIQKEKQTKNLYTHAFVQCFYSIQFLIGGVTLFILVCSIFFWINVDATNPQMWWMKQKIQFFVNEMKLKQRKNISYTRYRVPYAWVCHLLLHFRLNNLITFYFIYLLN